MGIGKRFFGKHKSSEASYVSYSKRHENIVRSGVDAISKVLDGSDTEEKKSLLLCLDKYLDPWFGYNLPYTEQIIELIQRVIVSPNNKEVKEDALHLLTSYSWPPFEILKSNLEEIESDLLDDVLYAINMDKCHE